MNNVHSVAGDGECLFNAIAYGILFLPSRTKVSRQKYKQLAHKIRRDTVKKLMQKIHERDFDYIIPMSAEYNNSQKNFNEKQMINRAKLYTKRMNERCSWGGEIELQVLGTIVHSYGYRGIKVYNITNKRLLMNSAMKRNKNPVLHLVLHGVSNGGVHYDFWDKIQKSKSVSIKEL